MFRCAASRSGVTWRSAIKISQRRGVAFLKLLTEIFEDIPKDCVRATDKMTILAQGHFLYDPNSPKPSSGEAVGYCRLARSCLLCSGIGMDIDEEFGTISLSLAAVVSLLNQFKCQRIRWFLFSKPDNYVLLSRSYYSRPELAFLSLRCHLD